MVRTAPTPGLLDASEWGESGESTQSVRQLLEAYLEISLLEEQAQAAALAAMVSEDDRQLFKYALSLQGADDLVELVDGIETRAAAASPEPPNIENREFEALHAAFAAMPAQLHHALLARLGPVREAIVPAVFGLGLRDATAIAPYVLPVLSAPTAEKAAELAAGCLGDPDAVEALIAAFGALSLAAASALTLEISQIEPALGVMCHLLAGKVLTADNLPQVYAAAKAFAACLKPPDEGLKPLHEALRKLQPPQLARLVAVAAEAGPLLESTPYLELDAWVQLVGACAHGDRLAVDARKVARALLRVEATHLKTWIVHNPEERALLGFFAGWFVFLISLFGILEELVAARPLYLMLDIYILLLAALTCLLEVKSTLLRDHLTLWLERHFGFVRFATGRGCLYFATGFLAFDTQSSAQVLGGGMMLLVGLFNVALGTWVAPKLKKLRKAVADEAQLLAKFRAVESERPEGLNAAEMERLCDACGVHFNRLEMQAVFLELDSYRDGLISQPELLTWYHGHVHPLLKRLANAPPAEPRSLRQWVAGGLPHGVLYELPLYAAAGARLLVPSAVIGMAIAVVGSRAPNVVRQETILNATRVVEMVCLSPSSNYEAVDPDDWCSTTPSGFSCCPRQRSVVQLVINFFLLLCAALMWVLETRSEGYRKAALHVLRYASVLLHLTARGALYLLVALALLAQGGESAWLAFLGYALEALGILHIFVGLRVASRLRLLRRKLPTPQAARDAFQAVAHGRSSIGLFQLRLLCQTHAVPLGWQIEQHALLTTLDLDRTGKVLELELLFWMSEGADGGGALEPGAVAGGADGAEWLGGGPPVAPMAAADEAAAPPNGQKTGGSSEPWQDL